MWETQEARHYNPQVGEVVRYKYINIEREWDEPVIVVREHERPRRPPRSDDPYRNCRGFWVRRPGEEKEWLTSSSSLHKLPPLDQLAALG